MTDANRRIKLFRPIEPSYTAFGAARRKRTKSCRSKRVGHTKEEDKPPSAVSRFPRELLNADLIRISGFLSFHVDGGYAACYGFQIRYRGPPFLAFGFPNVQKRRNSAILIKVAKNGIESEQFQLTKKRRRTLLLGKPDTVFAHIDSLYPKGPENRQIVELSFPCLNLLAHEFILEENRQEKQSEQHQDYRAMEDINPRGNGALMTPLEEIYLRQEIRHILYEPSNVLTDLQQRRLRFFLDEYILAWIGEIEGISHTAVRKPVISAIEKIREHFE